ncbi:hypothetical protein [Curtobacterium sp. MCSS17_016]|uniref:hypothetical protein n=1 Tax=Curtobacterium sp. MCSS17_016 TaxID=2175644 RepID=UPI000DA976C8|nr:hypothetical protein [Curtobacterium sp. MCSS17_016]WIE81073.1 hypothetical protein DEJ19_021515 [Curtobacterium sp. MCSS17_016]
MRPTKQVLALEAKYADRGLRFGRDREGRVAGMGSVPVQAFGHIDGQRFYFRFRRDDASIRVGPFDEALELALWERGEQVRKDRLAKLEASGERYDDDGRESFMWLFDSRPSVAPSADDASFAPSRTTAVAAEWDIFNDPYLGTLEDDQFEQLFTRLIDALEPVDEDDQVSALTIQYLTEGGLWPLPTSEGAHREHPRPVVNVTP